MEQLTAALADRYRVERELGRGGMATVYLAHDLKHDRPVALKVLHPEIAASLGPERFIREIRVTARLQHPHILPVFDSGAVDGRPWYSMPYVRGESLRERLRREVQLPLDTALDITRQVAHALAYAHREGAVHRDIKPENILLSEGQALVADFGVARAIGAAGDQSLTGTGIAIGTPSYMAPEQASGGRTDGRTDIYALSCVLYELLAGEPPFTGPTPQAILAKRLAHPAPSLLTVRPTVPEVVAEAVRKAMAPVPADRFATATEFAQALQESVSQAGPKGRSMSGSGGRVPARRALTWAALAAVVLAAAGGAYAGLRALGVGSRDTLLSSGVMAERERLLIADFQSRAPDSLLGPAVTEAFRIDLARSPVVTLVPSAEVAQVLERMRRPPAPRLDPALAREVAIRQGIKVMVTGEVALVGNAYLLSVQLVSPRTGQVLAAHREAAPDANVIVPAIDRLSKRLRETIGESVRAVRSEPALDQVTTSSLEALWKYAEAIRAGDGEGDYPKAATLLEQAVALDTGFATAYRTLGGVLLTLGERERAVEAYTRAIQHLDRLTDLERDHTLAMYHDNVTFELDKAVAAYRAALDRHPNDSAALNNLGVIYLFLGQPARAESLFLRLRNLGVVDQITALNLTRVQLALGRPGEAEATFKRAVEEFGDSVGHMEWLGMALPGALGDYPTAERRARAALERHIGSAERRFAARHLAVLASTRGRLADSERYLREAMAVSAREEPVAQYLEDAVALGFLDIWFRREPQRGLRTVEAALRRHPLRSVKPLDRPYLSLAIAYAFGGRPQRARALLSELEQAVSPRLRGPDEALRRWTLGQVAMAEGRFTDAVTEFQAFAASPRNCKPCGLAALAHAYDRVGQPDSAIATYERYVMTLDLYRLTEVMRFDNDGTRLAPAHRRLGELYEDRGDSARARRHYARFVELWRECDPELRPAVNEVEQRLLQLGGEN